MENQIRIYDWRVLQPGDVIHLYTDIGDSPDVRYQRLEMVWKEGRVVSVRRKKLKIEFEISHLHKFTIVLPDRLLERVVIEKSGWSG